MAQFVRDRVSDLKSQGYKRIIVGGQSWGAWVTMVAAQGTDLNADGIFLLVPAAYGKRTSPDGQPNASFSKNKTEFVPLLKSINKPVAAVFFSEDEFDPGGRGKLVEEQGRSRKLPYLVIDDPPGFKGHAAGWLPIFDYVFGKCIQLFLETLRSQQCELPALSPTDFRSIVHRSQIPDFDAKRIVAPDDLVGHSYVVFSSEGDNSSRAWEVEFKSQSLAVRQTAKSRRELTYQLNEGDFCQQNRCNVLIQWDDQHMIAFDRSTGAATAWWIKK